MQSWAVSWVGGQGAKLQGRAWGWWSAWVFCVRKQVAEVMQLSPPFISFRTWNVMTPLHYFFHLSSFEEAQGYAGLPEEISSRIASERSTWTQSWMICKWGKKQKQIMLKLSRLLAKWWCDCRIGSVQNQCFRLPGDSRFMAKASWWGERRLDEHWHFYE
jgi:hypothetical protein